MAFSKFATPFKLKICFYFRCVIVSLFGSYDNRRFFLVRQWKVLGCLSLSGRLLFSDVEFFRLCIMGGMLEGEGIRVYKGVERIGSTLYQTYWGDVSRQGMIFSRWSCAEGFDAIQGTWGSGGVSLPALCVVTPLGRNYYTSLIGNWSELH